MSSSPSFFSKLSFNKKSDPVPEKHLTGNDVLDSPLHGLKGKIIALIVLLSIALLSAIILSGRVMVDEDGGSNWQIFAGLSFGVYLGLIIATIIAFKSKNGLWNEITKYEIRLANLTLHKVMSPEQAHDIQNGSYSNQNNSNQNNYSSNQNNYNNNQNNYNTAQQNTNQSRQNYNDLID